MYRPIGLSIVMLGYEWSCRAMCSHVGLCIAM